MAFPVAKKLDLTYLGEGWSQGAFINYSALTFSETRKFATSSLDVENPQDPKNLDVVITMLREHFLDGKAWNGKELVDLGVNDIEQLPTEVVTKSIELLAGGPSENLPKN